MNDQTESARSIIVRLDRDVRKHGALYWGQGHRGRCFMCEQLNTLTGGQNTELGRETAKQLREEYGLS